MTNDDDDAQDQPERFNAAIAAECEAHREEEHGICPRCGLEWCMFYTESNLCGVCGVRLVGPSAALALYDLTAADL